MKKIPLPLPTQSKAYMVFLEELAAHLDRVEHWLDEALRAHVDAAAAADLQVGFHRAKGGGGFFGLDEIAAIAARLEERFAKPGAAAAAAPEIQNEVAQLRQLLARTAAAE